MHKMPPVAPPWWQVGPMWLVVLGPVVVVIASFVTLVVALRIPDPVVSENYYSEGLALSKKASKPNEMLPATQARDRSINSPPDSGAAKN